MKCEIQKGKEGTRVIPEGDIDMHSSGEFRAILRNVVDEKPAQIIVDLSRVPFMDSSGIATMVESLKLSRKSGGGLRIVNCQEAVRDVLDIAGLTKILGVS